MKFFHVTSLQCAAFCSEIKFQTWNKNC